MSSPTKVAEAQHYLAGKNLACRCDLGAPCHGRTNPNNWAVFRDDQRLGNLGPAVSKKCWTHRINESDQNAKPRGFLMPPLALSDEQLTCIMRLAAPLPPVDRAQFLTEVAAKLAECPQELRGDGTVARIGAEIQKRYWRPPSFSAGKYD